MAKRKQVAAEQAAEQTLPQEMTEQTTEGAASLPEQPPQEIGPQAQRRSPDPFGIASDYLAGVHLRESRQYRQMQIKFDEKPSREVLDTVKADGFRWSKPDEAWVKQYKQDTAMRTRIDAERFFQQVADMIRGEKGIAQVR